MTSARHVSVKQLPEKLSVKQGRNFFREVEPHLQSDRPRVVLDCSKVRQLDSAGIHVLLRVLEEAMKRNGDVKLASIPPGAAAILELTRVSRLFETFDNTADAVNSFQPVSDHCQSRMRLVTRRRLSRPECGITALQMVSPTRTEVLQIRKKRSRLRGVG